MEGDNWPSPFRLGSTQSPGPILTHYPSFSLRLILTDNVTHLLANPFNSLRGSTPGRLRASVLLYCTACIMVAAALRHQRCHRLVGSPCCSTTRPAAFSQPHTVRVLFSRSPAVYLVMSLPETIIFLSRTPPTFELIRLLE